MIAPCDTCKKTIDRQDSWMTGKRHFCDKECHKKFQAILKGEETNNWRGGGYKFTCAFCLQPCERRRNPITPRYCSIECAAKDRAQGLQGEKHHNWKGGIDRRYLRKVAPRPIPDRCEVCTRPATSFKKGLMYDHCHVSGKFRGWLCTNCNTALGLVKENKQTLYALIKYLEVNEKSSLIDSNAEMPTRRKSKDTVRD